MRRGHGCSTRLGPPFFPVQRCPERLQSLSDPESRFAASTIAPELNRQVLVGPVLGSGMRVAMFAKEVQLPLLRSGTGFRTVCRKGSARPRMTLSRLPRVCSRRSLAARISSNHFPPFPQSAPNAASGCGPQMLGRRARSRNHLRLGVRARGSTRSCQLSPGGGVGDGGNAE